jgi:HEAT repeat protein
MSKFSFATVLTATLLAAGFTQSMAQEPTPLLTRPEDQLIATLKSGASLREKMEACRELSVIGSPQAVAPLADLLPDAELSHMARYGLEPLPYPEVDQAFREALSNLTGRELVGVIGSIGVRKDAQAVKPLARRLNDGDPDVAQAAARALGSIGTAAAARTLESALDRVSDENRLAFAEGLFRCAEQLPRGAARRAYDRLREVDSPHQVRAGALRGAILIRGSGGVKLLRQSIQSGDLILVHAALRTAGEMPGTEVTTALTRTLNSLPDDTQILVLQSLGVRADPTSIPSIAARATTGSSEVRLVAIRALAEVGASAAVDPLVKLLRDGNTQIAQAAQESLAALPGPEADAAARALLGAGDKSDRLLGIELVSRRRMMSSMPVLFTAAKDPDAQIRAAAIRRLGDMGGADELPALLDLLAYAGSGSEVEATEQALGAVLSRIDKPGSQTPKLIAHLVNAKPAQKAALIRSLGVIGDQAALEAVCAAVPDSSVRTAALRTLASWKTADAAPELLGVARKTTDATERTIALRGYLGWASNRDLPADQRLTMCREAAGAIEQPDDKKLLLGALGRIHNLESLELIAPYLADAEVREEASAATVAIAEELLKGDNANRVAPRLVEPLQHAAKSTTNDELVRKAQTLLQQAQAKSGT